MNGKMTNYKVQISNKKEVGLAFNLPAKARLACWSHTASRQAGHLDFNCDLDFGIWNLANEIATHFPGARNDTPPCHCEERSDEAISWKARRSEGLTKIVPLSH
jgi:hypothetical protein